MKKIIIVGGVNIDVVSQMEILPGPGQGVMGPAFQFIPGGKGANQAVAASRLGGKVSFFGKVGNDQFGKTVTAFLKREKLRLQYLGISKSSPTGMALIFVDKTGRNMMAATSGANFDISIGQVESLSIQKGDILVSTLENPQPVIKALFKRARARGAVIVLNAAPAWPASRDLFALADYLILNEHELIYFGINAKAIKKQTVVVTLGKKGLICWQHGEKIKITGHRVKAVDTTAAGDAFVGAFAVALAENKNLKAVLKFANAAAAVSVQKLGASSSLPTRQKVDAFIKSIS